MSGSAVLDSEISHPVHLHSAAQIIGVKPHTLRNRSWRTRHRVPAIRVGRLLLFDPRQLVAWLDERREQPRGAA